MQEIECLDGCRLGSRYHVNGGTRIESTSKYKDLAVELLQVMPREIQVEIANRILYNDWINREMQYTFPTVI